MNKKQIFLGLLFSITLLINVRSFAQDASIHVKKAFVLAYSPKQKLLRVDIEGDNVFGDVETHLEVTSNSRLLDKKKKKELDLSLLRPGLQIEFQGLQYGEIIQVNEIVLLTNLSKKNDKADGVLENKNGKRAVIDGQRVVLNPDVKITGIGSWKGREYYNFDVINLGVFAKAEGSLKADGILYADKVKIEPNEYINADYQVRQAFANGLQIQQGLVAMGAHTNKLVENQKIQNYVNLVGNKLIPTYLQDMPDGPSKINFRFYVIEEPSFNAFAFSDGSVFIHSGLLEILENEAQLAAVLAHEIVHVTHEHRRKQLQTGNLLNTAKTATDMLTKKDTENGKDKGGKLKDKIGSIGKNIGGFFRKDEKGLQDGIGADFDPVQFVEDVTKNNFFSKPMENQADRVGLFYMYKGGYDPREAINLWERILQFSNPHTAADEMKSVYASHPTAKNRIRNINREIALHYHDVDLSETQLNQEAYKQFLLNF